MEIGPRGGFYYKRNGYKVYVNAFGSSSFGKKPKRSNERMWKNVVAEVKRSSKGGKPGQWSARKAQLAVKIYKERGGRYSGRVSKDNALKKWTRENWRTKSGKPSVVGKNATGERYLPEKAIKRLSDAEYKRTSRLKRNSKKQYSKQPKDIAKKTSSYR